MREQEQFYVCGRDCADCPSYEDCLENAMLEDVCPEEYSEEEFNDHVPEDALLDMEFEDRISGVYGIEDPYF